MSSQDYLNKLNVIVEDITKIKLVEKDNRKNARQPFIKRIEKVKEMMKSNIKPYINSKTYNTLIKGRNSAGKL